MKTLYKFLFTVTSLLVLNLSATAQTSSFTVKVNNPPVPYTGNAEWGNDFLVSDSEPLGRPSGIYRNSNSTIYVSVPDTNIQSGASVVILASTNDGANWSNIASASSVRGLPVAVSKTKMIRSSLDSIYCYFRSGNSVFCWNVLNSVITQVRSTNYRDFDVAASSTGSMYIFLDSLGSNGLIRYGSSDGGITWPTRGLISSGAAFPKVYMSGYGDTLILNYYGPVLADTATSVIRSVRYRETAPATMAVTGAFSNVATSNAPKSQFGSVILGLNVWFFYTSEDAGNIDIKCKVSTNASVSFSDSTVIGSSNSLEYWFDAKHHNRGAGGADIIYYSVALVSHRSQGILDQINYSTALIPGLTSFSTPVQFADHPPVVSPIGYIPTLIEYYNGASDAGVIYVGEADGPNPQLYFDRLNAVSTLNLTVNLEACSPMQDTITALIRNVSSPYDVVDSARGYLSPTGTLSVNYTKVLNGRNYYLVVKHRNSIETWSKSGGEVFTAGALSYDFTTALSQAYQSNQVLVSGKSSIYTGDVEQNGIVDLTDLVAVFNDATSFLTGYVVTDLNCDNAVTLTDIVYAYNNSSNFVSIKRP